MLTPEIIRVYLERTVAGLKADAANKNQRIPQDFRIETDEKGGRLYAADYFKYLITGRGPGKMPPVEPIRQWAEKLGLTGRDPRGRFITSRSLAWSIAIGIAKKGTQIFQGKKPGIDFLGVMETNMPSLLSTLAKNEAFNIATALVKDLK